MKTPVAIIAVFFCAAVAAVGESEGWTSLGFEFGNSFQSAEGADDVYLGSPGFNWSGFAFQDSKAVGFFFHYAFLAPVIGDTDNYDLHWNFIFGPVFRHNYSRDFALYAGAGFDFAITGGDRTDGGVTHSTVMVDWGIGGDFGVKYDFTDYCYVSAGISWAYLFANTTVRESETIVTANGVTTTTTVTTFNDQQKRYALVDANPYVAIGFNYYTPGKTTWGKKTSPTPAAAE
jgi:hypothetical protein